MIPLSIFLLACAALYLGVIEAAFGCAGERCMAGSTAIAVGKAADRVLPTLVEAARAIKVGPTDVAKSQPDMGPVITAQHRDRIFSLVESGAKEGAKIIADGRGVKVPDAPNGFFMGATIVDQVQDNMTIAREEVFGPVAPITVVDNEAEAIKLTNDSEYGLGASIWTEDIDKAERLSRAVESGIVVVNNVVASDPRVPFGGVKKSGFGRELSRYGMLEFVNIKSIRFYDQLIHHHHVE